MESFLKFLLAVVASFVTALCMAIMWRWFVTPLGVPAISTIHALGICYIFALFSTKDHKREVSVEKLVYGMLFDGLALLFGFLVHLAM